MILFLSILHLCLPLTITLVNSLIASVDGAIYKSGFKSNEDVREKNDCLLNEIEYNHIKIKKYREKYLILPLP